MRKIYLGVMFVLFVGGLTAQTRTTTKSKTTTSQNKKNTPRKTVVTTGTSSVKDRINQRLKDSAAAATSGVTNTTTVINGITVPANTTKNSNGSTVSPNTAITTNSTTVNSNVNTNASTTTGGNSVTNTGSPVQGRPIPGTIPVTPTNPANVQGKPITQEQTKYSSTDVNRTQMNAINGNQVASAVQNSDNTTKHISGNMIESQWGTNQVGENQWTPPNNVISGFTRDFPGIRGATWTRDNAMNTFVARYRTNDLWTISTYNNNGIQTETRTELPLAGTMPEPLLNFKSRQSALVDYSRISRVDRPGQPTLYEVRLSTGRIAYINNLGEEVTVN